MVGLSPCVCIAPVGKSRSLTLTSEIVSPVGNKIDQLPFSSVKTEISLPKDVVIKISTLGRSGSPTFCVELPLVS